MFSFLCIVKQKKILERSENFRNFSFLKIYIKKNVWKVGFQYMLILGLLGMYFDAAVVFVTKSSLFFRLAVAILWHNKYKHGHQSSRFPPKLDWIGCAIYQANPKRLPGFFFFLTLQFLFLFFKIWNHFGLRPMPAHFWHLLF